MSDEEEIDRSGRRRTEASGPEVTALTMAHGQNALAIGDAETTRTMRVPARTPFGGAFVAIPSNGIVPLARWEVPDGVPRKATVFTGAPFPTLNFGAIFYGVAIRVTQGGIRGSYQTWHGCPSIIPVVGTYVLVEAMLCDLPFALGFRTRGTNSNTGPTGTQGTNGPVPTQGGSGLGNFMASALIVDGQSDEPAGEDVTNNPICNWAAQGTNTPGTRLFGPQAQGPVVITSAAITNTATSPVLMGIFDTVFEPASTINVPAIGTVYVPAGTTVGIGRDLLGSFFQGLTVVGITAASAVAGPDYVIDTNTTSVVIQARGFYLNQGTAT